MTRANRLIGLPVVREGSRLGVVDAVSLARNGKRLGGLHVQGRALRASYVPADAIQLLGAHAILVQGASMARAPRFQLGRVRDTSGLRLGVVTDTLLSEDTLAVEAVELSFGPLDDLLRGRCWVSPFSVDSETGDVIVSCGAWLERDSDRDPAQSHGLRREEGGKTQ
jgi:uncharacterized protein YrrD